MIITAIFAIAFSWSVSRGLRKNRTQILNERKLYTPIGMSVPAVTTSSTNTRIMHLHDYLILKSRKKDIQTIKLRSVPPEAEEMHIYLN